MRIRGKTTVVAGLLLTGTLTAGILLGSGRDTPDPLVFTGEQDCAFQPGDILVRPNAGWLPGSCRMSGGRKFGHAAIVVKGSSGRTWEEALEHTLVIEAFIYDQGKRGFEWNPRKQVRLAPASVSFGSRFADRRYRLRSGIPPDGDTLMAAWLQSLPGNARYSLFTSKKQLASRLRDGKFTGRLNCATLVWFAFRFARHTDTDANGGAWVYPNDLICSPVFDPPGNRTRF
jgi:hypothetical protein